LKYSKEEIRDGPRYTLFQDYDNKMALKNCSIQRPDDKLSFNGSSLNQTKPRVHNVMACDRPCKSGKSTNHVFTFEDMGERPYRHHRTHNSELMKDTLQTLSQNNNND